MTDNFSIEHEQDALAELDKIKEQFKQSSPDTDLENSLQAGASEDESLAGKGASLEEPAAAASALAASDAATAPAAAAEEGKMEKKSRKTQSL